MTASMKFENSYDNEGRAWPRWLRAPIAQALLFSFALHCAMIVLIQSEPSASGRRTVVINAYLRTETAPMATPVEAEPAQTEPYAEPLAKPDSEPKPVANLMTATTPSPAPPMPLAPVPAKENVVEPKALPSHVPVSTPVSAPSVAPTDASRSANKAPGPQQASGLPSLPLGIDSHWYQALQVDNQPKAIGLIEPVYPEDAQRRNLEGTLKLMLKIDDLGRVQSAEVVESTPPGVFDAAALAAFRAARFQPAIKDGRPVRYQAFMRVDFKLKD
ncbi:MAG: hypothetical protein B7Y41_11650 [Hydrogenophilales bacterium 28-61-23]|nr:MAG: hypothetical protein B7Y41_11650 [Hydrogenophilales bacterium 28-61-23]